MTDLPPIRAFLDDRLRDTCVGDRSADDYRLPIVDLYAARHSSTRLLARPGDSK